MAGMARRLSACLFLVAVPLVQSCTSVAPKDDLTWSAPLGRTLPLQKGDTIAVARFSELRPGGSDFGGWEPWIVLRGNTLTDYRLVEDDGVVVVRADARAGGSGLFRKIRIDPHREPILEWRWRVPVESGAGGARGPSAVSPPVRLALAFDGDTSKLDFDDRAKLRLAKALTPNGLPYASLLYVWLMRSPAETVYASPHTQRVRHIVVESGPQRLGQWVVERRNVLEDYRRAFHEEPGHIVGVGVMTDYGDNGGPRRAFYGDITFSKASGCPRGCR
jgi:hypothetical protein